MNRQRSGPGLCFGADVLCSCFSHNVILLLSLLRPKGLLFVFKGRTHLPTQRQGEIWPPKRQIILRKPRGGVGFNAKSQRCRGAEPERVSSLRTETRLLVTSAGLAPWLQIPQTPCVFASLRLCVKNFNAAPTLAKISGSPHRDLVIEPGPGMSPVIPGRARGDVQQAGGFLGGQADEIPQLYQFRLGRVLRGELIERLIDR